MPKRGFVMKFRCGEFITAFLRIFLPVYISYRVRQITSLAQIPSNHLEVVQILRKPQTAKTWALLQRTLSAILLVLIRLVSSRQFFFHCYHSKLQWNLGWLTSPISGHFPVSCSPPRFSRLSRGTRYKREAWELETNEKRKRGLMGMSTERELEATISDLKGTRVRCLHGGKRILAQGGS